MKGKRFLLLATMLLGLVFYGCDEESNDETLSGKGTISVKLTDAPFPADLIAEANVTINKVEVRTSDEVEGNPFTTLMEEEMSFNLLELRNGVTANLAELEIPVGSYDLVRLYVSDASIMLLDSTWYDLKVPSGAQTGIKVFIDPSIEVAGGLTSELLLDFDVSQSFVVKGNIDSLAGIKGFNFKPVIKAANLSTAGRLVGMVTDSLDSAVVNANVKIMAADTLYTSSLTDTLGYYAVLGLEAGSYDVVFEHNDYQTLTVEDIEIVAANKTTLDAKLAE